MHKDLSSEIPSFMTFLYLFCLNYLATNHCLSLLVRLKIVHCVSFDFAFQVDLLLVRYRLKQLAQW